MNASTETTTSITLLSLSSDEGCAVDKTVFDNTLDFLIANKGLGIKHVRRLNERVCEIQYDGFVVQLCVAEDGYRRGWSPDYSYDKNYFATLFYNGESTEYSVDDKPLEIFTGFINHSLVNSKASYEVYHKSAWLCFSSWKPYTAELLNVRESGIIPAKAGALIAIGTVDSVRALDYLEPVDTDRIVKGYAQIVLIKEGQFVNVPSD